MVAHWNHPDGQGEYDRVQLGGIWLPGISWAETETDTGLKIHKAKGANLATMTNEGTEPAKVMIYVQIDDLEEELTTWHEVKRLLLRPRHGTPEPLSIVHPNPNGNRVDAVAIKKIREPRPSAIEGLLITIEAYQWVPAPKPAKTLATKAKGDASANGGPNADRDAKTTGPSKTSAALDNLAAALEGR